MAATGTRKSTRAAVNKLLPEDRPAHDWYRFVLSYPPHLVREYLQRFEVGTGDAILDPFCGTGTTVVECQKNGFLGIGVEANPVAHFASQVKLDWSPSPDGLIASAEQIATVTRDVFRSEGISDGDLPLFDKSEAAQSRTDDPGVLETLASDAEKLLLTDSISPMPLHKTLRLLEQIRQHAHRRHRDHLLLAAMKAVVFSISDLHFGPEVGVSRIKKDDANVVGTWMHEVEQIATDLRVLKPLKKHPGKVTAGDARSVSEYIEPKSVSAVITSPPYPNEKDYTRTTRLESVLLGYLDDRQSLRELKKR